jgi:hypothetical protein
MTRFEHPDRVAECLDAEDRSALITWRPRVSAIVSEEELGSVEKAVTMFIECQCTSWSTVCTGPGNDGHRCRERGSTICREANTVTTRYGPQDIENAVASPRV